MNCKPQQLAWISVLRCYYGSGLEQLNGQVVKTVSLARLLPEPTWLVTPRQSVTFTMHTVDRSGQRIAPGSTMWTDEIPDSFLRPFDPKSELKGELELRELAHTA